MLASKIALRGSSAVMGLRRIPQSQLALPRLASRQFSSMRPSIRPQFLKPSRIQAILPLTTLRFNSSLPTTTTLPTPTAIAAAEAAGTIPAHTIPENELPDYIPSVESLTPPLPTTEYPGFLYDLGLNYGTGPTTVLQYLLENVHLLTGTPWWASIMITVFAIRAAQFPFYMRLSDTTARMKELNPQVVPLTKKMREAQMRNDTKIMVAVKHQISDIYRKAGVNRLWMAFPITQIPIFYGFYKNLYGMAEVKVPGLVEGGKWWFGDLSCADPYFILPLVSSLSMGLQIWLGGEAGATMQSQRLKKGMVLTLPIISFAFVHSWPAALTLYFFTNSMFGLCQATALRNAWVRDKLGLYPLDPAASKNPLAPGNAEGLDALNLAKRAGPASKIIDVGAPKQIGGQGGFLDQITGGNVKKDGKKKSLLDRVLGEKLEGEQQSGLGQIWQDKWESGKHNDYEEKRKKRLAKEAAVERERRKRAGIDMD